MPELEVLAKDVEMPRPVHANSTHKKNKKPQKTTGKVVRRVQLEGFLGKKVGRNQPCICGSGLKFKRCCALTQRNY